jgi:serine/threonine protein kinase
MTSGILCQACAGSNDDNSLFCIHCGHRVSNAGVELDSSALVPGTTVREFRISRLLGEGGMGQVYEATHVITGEKVAVKRMLPGLANDAAVLRRFLEEARTMTLLKHQSIVQLKQFFEVQGRFFLIMDFIEGRSAADIAADYRDRGQSVPVETAVEILVPVADALNFIHTLRTTQAFVGEDGVEVTRRIDGVVHRDIKPDNILVNREGQPFLMDFGIAKPEGRERMTRIGGVVGTYEFMSPEQIRGEAVGPQTDQYALAVTLYQLLAGTAPYPQKSEAGFEVMEGHLRGEIPSIRQIRDDVPLAMEKVLRRGMAKDPAQRFENCHAFGHALSSSLSEPASFPTNEQPERMTLPAEDYDGASVEQIGGPPKMAIAAGLVVAAILLGIVVAWGMGMLEDGSKQSTTKSTREEPPKRPSSYLPDPVVASVAGEQFNDRAHHEDEEEASRTRVDRKEATSLPSQPLESPEGEADESLQEVRRQGELVEARRQEDMVEAKRQREMVEARRQEDMVDAILERAGKALSEGRLSDAKVILEGVPDELSGNTDYRRMVNSYERARSQQEYGELLRRASVLENDSQLAAARTLLLKAESLAGVDPGEATRRRVRIDARIAAIERNKVNWYCLCYKERIGGLPTLSTACRGDWSACQKLAQTVNGGRKPFVKDSVSRGCTLVRAEYPWDSLGSQNAWKPSKRPGSWWSDRGCFVP